MLLARVCFVFCLLAHVGCQSARSILLTDQEEFKLAQTYMEEKKWDKARLRYQRILDRYPGSALAAQAYLGKAESFYQNKNCLAAQTEYQLFLEFYPAHEQAPQALYRIGLCQYKNLRRFDRDQQPTLEARDTFQRLLQSYPRSEFSQEAREKLADCFARLLQHDKYVSNFYLRRDFFLGAALRHRKMLAVYPLEEGEKAQIEAKLAELWKRFSEQRFEIIEANYERRAWFGVIESFLMLRHYRPELPLGEKTRFYYAEALLGMERREEASEAFEALQRDFPEGEFVGNAQERLRELSSEQEPTQIEGVFGP